MSQYIDLRPILADPALAEVLLLARGQLNRAFRQHGLVPPDSLVPSTSSDVDVAELDDPAGLGIEAAMAKFQDDFLVWAGAMPAKLGAPVLDILRQALGALSPSQDDPSGSRAALTRAYEFLSGCIHPEQGGQA
jgi:hypothetical protein